jgi:hypothetical protein
MIQRGAVADSDVQGTVEVKVEWPADIYRDAGIANIFVLSDDGQGLYVGLGHLPPLTGKPPVGVTVVPTVRAAVYLTYKNAAELAQLFTDVVERKKKELEEHQKRLRQTSEPA